jgi:hypothetical protein
VDRDLLVRLLSGDENDAFTACRLSVVAGARFWVSDHAQPASELARTYQRRAGHAQQAGIPTLGFSTAVQALQRYGEHRVRLGAVDVGDPPCHFQLFFDENLTSIVACLGVDQDPAHHRPKG